MPSVLSGVGPAPPELISWLRSWSRQDAVLDQSFDLNVAWWNARIIGLPGGPVKSADDSLDRGPISRRYLFGLGEEAVTDDTGEAALRLLWHTLLWGTGNSNRGNRRRIDSIRVDPAGMGRLLHSAAATARTDPAEAFRLLRRRRATVKGFGPAFFTKFLYFAGGGDPRHPCLIVDSRVQRTLHTCTGGQHALLKPDFGYRVDAYIAALTVLETWAAELSVAGDEVERWAFAHTGPRTEHRP
ncbi:8-oxoguanine DNA glycosylase OGG fold protein [Phytoactinopolyspora halotolerans]|uniref:Uncharacterized protein n=1 Tax=Phytoactinopolyspora halotolerans TaxID=1981512 RepID=A0A6L9S843_9ACTN|nr:hypothetical protein [Phytoactinopolyspora halotolerans]NEE01183.1 hypothetical protein [Phytoactinopolyspora halotolerans]